MLILSLETSCDETACAIGKSEKNTFSLLANIVSSQVELHAQWGGVVPNLAAREHLKNILPIIEEALQQAHVSLSEIDLISVTNGPGLIPALLIGTSTAKTLAYLWQKPLLGINHLEGHLSASFIDTHSPFSIPFPAQFPALGLLVSGGHTQLILLKKPLDYNIIGETVDDAVGEAFDKVARILGLGYPGGPLIADQALLWKKFLTSKHSEPTKLAFNFSLPRPMLHTPNFNFSFSGLKTAVLYLTKKNKPLLNNKKFIQKICYEFQQAVIDVLITKTLKALEKYPVKTVLLGGGVASNQALRQQLTNTLHKKFPLIQLQIPNNSYCGDNAAMIAMAGFWRWQQKKNQISFQQEINHNWYQLKTEANLPLI